MSDDDKPTPEITERQREARRENGRRSRGPKTPEGKARSSQNAVTHGAYAVRVPVIGIGPMKEEGDEVAAFYEDVIKSLDPGESPILRFLAGDVAGAMWRALRSAVWESAAYAAYDPSPGLKEAAWHDQLATAKRAAADTLAVLDDPDIGLDELWNCLSSVGFHPAVGAMRHGRPNSPKLPRHTTSAPRSHDCWRHTSSRARKPRPFSEPQLPNWRPARPRRGKLLCQPLSDVT